MVGTRVDSNQGFSQYHNFRKSWCVPWNLYLGTALSNKKQCASQFRLLSEVMAIILLDLRLWDSVTWLNEETQFLGLELRVSCLHTHQLTISIYQYSYYLLIWVPRNSLPLRLELGLMVWGCQDRACNINLKFEIKCK